MNQAMSSNNLPPVRHLPQWSRVGRLEKPCSPRRLPPSQLPPLPPLSAAPPADRSRGEGAAVEPPCHSDTDPRVASMQRNIQFLQQQHKNTLEKLHAEIEYLRRENKELQYRMIMEPPMTGKRGTRSRRGVRPPAQGSEAQMEEPLQELRSSKEEPLSIGDGSEVLASVGRVHGPEMRGGLITSLQPLRIHSSPSHPPRAPTLQECEVIIRQLYSANSLQSQEIMRVKALLRDIVLSRKITPENLILTKTYLVDGTRKSCVEKKIPQLGLQTFPEKVSGPSQSGVSLPALKPSLSSSMAERQRRSRVVQRGRFKRTEH